MPVQSSVSYPYFASMFPFLPRFSNQHIHSPIHRKSDEEFERIIFSLQLSPSLTLVSLEGLPRVFLDNMVNFLRNFVNGVNERLERRAAQRPCSARREKELKAVGQCAIISGVISLLITGAYMAIILLVLAPNFEKHIISEAKAFPDPMTPRLNFLNMDYDNMEQRAKSVVIDVGHCAGIDFIQLHLTL
jgi:hypothetical protein